MYICICIYTFKNEKLYLYPVRPNLCPDVGAQGGSAGVSQRGRPARKAAAGSAAVMLGRSMDKPL